MSATEALPSSSTEDQAEARSASTGGPWPILPWVVPLIAVLLSRLQVGDLAYQLRAGDIMWRTWDVLRIDVFTYTIPGTPWLNQQWGAQLAFSAWFAAVGWRGLLALQAAIVAGCFGATYRRGVANGASAIVASCSTLLGFIVAAVLPGTLALRPQLLALPLFVTAAWIIGTRRHAPVRLAALVPIGIVWANVHGSFLLLTVLLTIAFVSDVVTHARTTPWTGVLVIVSLATPAVSPWGFGIYRYVRDLTTSPVVREAIAEWRPLWTRAPALIAFVLVCVVAGLAVTRRAGRRPTFEEAATLVVFTGLAVWSGRNLLWWAVIVPPVVSGLLAGWRPGGEWTPAATRIVLAATAVVVALGAWRVAVTPVEQLRAEAPAAITAWLASHPETHGRVFAEWWGGWFEYAVPEQPMFVDARVELFPQQVWNDYSAIVDDDATRQAVLDRWGVGTIVLARDHHPELQASLASDPAWNLEYQDADGYIFTRR